MQSLVEASKLHCLGRGDYFAFSRDVCIVESQMTWRTTFRSKKGQRTTFEKKKFGGVSLEAYFKGINSQVPSSQKKTACIYTNISNNQRLRSAGDNDRRSKRSCSKTSKAVLSVRFT